MGRAGTMTPGIPWYSWLALAVFLTFGAAMFYVTSGAVIPEALRWGVSIVWILVTLGLGLYDFIIKKGEGEGVDSTMVDRWTISHGGAGLVFGVWYMPLLYVVIMVVMWEIFELTVKGFGEKEVFVNRLFDIGIALALWFAVVFVAALATSTDFPFVTPAR